MTQTNAKEIAALLNRAGEAHHEYEQTVLKGIYDQDWAMWYAEYAIAHGLELLLNQRLTKAQLSLFLSEINQKYNQEQSRQSWAEYTAKKIVEPK
jgi:fructosamine-3-kinase